MMLEFPTSHLILRYGNFSISNTHPYAPNSTQGTLQLGFNGCFELLSISTGALDC